MTTSDEDGNENDTRLSQVPQVRIIREEQQRGLIHLHVLCPQVMHFVNRILHIQAAAQPPTPAALCAACQTSAHTQTLSTGDARRQQDFTHPGRGTATHTS